MILEVLSIGIALVTGALAVVVGMHLFARLSRGSFVLMEELQRGNVAIGVALAGVLFATAVLIQGGLWAFVNASALGTSFWNAVLQVAAGFALSLLVTNLGTRLFDVATPNVEVFPELRRGNVAVGVALAAYLVAIAWVVSTAVALLAW